MDSRRLLLISCEIFHREMCAAIASSPQIVDGTFLPKGLHDLPSGDMLGRLQTAVDAVAPDAYEAILMGYGLCNNGLAGLTARHTPLVVPRAHDCITLFLGGRERYLDYFNANPGVYFLTTGWIERDKSRGELAQLSIQRQTGMDSTYQQLVEKYGKDNADFLYEELCGSGTNHYAKYAYIAMGVEPDDRYERHAEELAASRGWQYEKLAGDMGIIERLVSGSWDEREFLVVPPGHKVVADVARPSIIRAVPATP